VVVASSVAFVALPDAALACVFRRAADRRELAECCARLRRVRALPASASTGVEDERRAAGGVDFGLGDEAHYDAEVRDEWYGAVAARAMRDACATRTRCSRHR